LFKSENFSIDKTKLTALLNFAQRNGYAIKIYAAHCGKKILVYMLCKVPAQ